jgi:hypothetical protein
MPFPAAAIMFSPVIPLWVIILCALPFGFFAWRTYSACTLSQSERFFLWSLRMLAFACLACILLQPSRRETQLREEKPVLAVVLDCSASMRDNPYQQPQNRSQRALAFLKKSHFKRKLADYRVKYFSAGATLQEDLVLSSDLAFAEPRSLLAPALNQVAERLRGENLAGVLLLSDGLDQSAAWLEGRARQVPVYIPELEDPPSAAQKPQQDFFLQEIQYPKRATVNWELKIEATIRRKNGAEPQTFPVELRQHGSTLRSTEVSFATNENFKRVSLTYEPAELGNQLFQLAIVPEDDSERKNNQREFVIDVTDAQKRILYLEGVPRWEFKFLKRALLTDKQQQLTAFVQSAGGAFINFDEHDSSAAAALPEFTDQTLREFSTIILGDLSDQALSGKDCQSIAKFVENGGGLLFLGSGRSCGPEGVLSKAEFKDLVPVVSPAGAQMLEQRTAVSFTAAGRAEPAFAPLLTEPRLPPLLSYWSPVEPGPFSTVFLATAEASPVLVGRRFGQGRAGIILSDSLWRWQLGSEAGGTEKSLYGRFITQLLQWLSPSNRQQNQDNGIQLLLAEQEVDLWSRVQIGALCGKAVDSSGLACRIITPEGKSLALPMVPANLGEDFGLSQKESGFACEFVPELPGTYKLEVMARDGLHSEGVLLLAKQPALEYTGEPIQRQWLQRLARDSGGTFLPWADSDRLLANLKGNSRSIEIVREYSLWNRWPWLALLISLFCLEWYFRRRWDLV